MSVVGVVRHNSWPRSLSRRDSFNGDINGEGVSRDDRGWTPLHVASRMGDLEEVQRLLDEGAEVNAPSWGPKAPGTTPLHLASTGGHLHVMDMLLERGANIEARTKGGCGWTPLHNAAKEKNKRAVRFLLENVSSCHHLFLDPTIVGTTPELAKFVTSSPKLFGHEHPRGIEEVAPKAFINKDGPSYMTFKKLFPKGLLPDSLKTKVGVLEEIVLHNLASWEQQGVVNARDMVIEATFDVACYMILGAKNVRKSEEGRHIFEDFKMFKLKD